MRFLRLEISDNCANRLLSHSHFRYSLHLRSEGNTSAASVWSAYATARSQFGPDLRASSNPPHKGPDVSQLCRQALGSRGNREPVDAAERWYRAARSQFGPDLRASSNPPHKGPDVSQLCRQALGSRGNREPVDAAERWYRAA